jgi:Flp pilus assembly secretin CpaC
MADHMKHRVVDIRMMPAYMLSMLSLALLLAAAPLLAQSQTPQVIRVIKGKSIVLSFPEKIKTISIANEAIIDVATITPTDAVVIGKDEGVTSLYIWGESGRYQSYDMKVDRSKTSQQVVLQVQIAEVNTSKMTDYGVDWLLRDTDDSHIIQGDKTIASYAGEVTSPDANTQNLFATTGISGAIKWIGDEHTAQMMVRALQENGNLRMLANPRLVCLSNEEASFLVGGEIPVPIAQQAATGGATAITIEWKEYGVKLKFTPTIVDTNLIRLKTALEVSSLDVSTSVTYAGGTIPGIRTRKADGTVELNSTQAIVLGGLRATETQEEVRRIPVLGHIPVLEFFFSKKQKTTVDNELLIIVSPRIIESTAQEVIPPLPGVVEDTTK